MNKNVNIMRVEKNKDNPYVILNKLFLENNKLSLKAKGLLCYLLSLPDDWKIYTKELEKHHKDGRESISSSLNELIKFKYIKREKIKYKGKFQGYNYIVFETPYEIQMEENPIDSEQKTVNGKTVNGKTVNGKPASTNNDLTNNNLTNNKKTSSVKKFRAKKKIKKNDDESFIKSNIKLKKESKEFIKNHIKQIKEYYGFDLIYKYIESTYKTKVDSGMTIKEVEAMFNFYLQNFNVYISSANTIRNIGAYYNSTVYNEIPMPISQNRISKIIQATNYDQRSYDDTFFNSLYDNIEFTK